LKALATVLYPNCEYDPDLNLMRALSAPAQPLGIKPPPYDSPPAQPQANGTTAILPVKPVPPTKRVGRPGWARLDWE
jgi:hypothetical protein